MCKWMLNCLLVAASSAVVPGGAWGADILFSDAIRNVSDGGIVAEAGPGDVLVFDGGVFDAGGRPLAILADTIRVDETTLILSHAISSVPETMEGDAGIGSSGRGGSTWGCRDETIEIGPFKILVQVCNLEGETGGEGQPGAGGRQGAVGAAIEIAF